MKAIRMIIVIVAVISLVSGAFAEEVMRTGRIADLKGRVEVTPAGGRRVRAKIGMVLNEGDFVKTHSKSWARLNLNGVETSIVEVEPNTQVVLSELTVDESRGSQKTMLDLAMGKVLCTAQKLHTEGSSFNIKTPTSVVGVRGTTFAVEVEGID